MFRRTLQIIRNLPLLVEWIKLGTLLPYDEKNVHEVSEVMIWIVERSFYTDDQRLAKVIRDKLKYNGDLDIATTTPSDTKKVIKISMKCPNNVELVFTKIWVIKPRM